MSALETAIRIHDEAVDLRDQWQKRRDDADRMLAVAERHETATRELLERVKEMNA